MAVSNKVKYSSDGLTLFRYPVESTARSFTLPAAVEVIGPEAFAGAKHLREVRFEPGSRLKRIETAAFRQSGVTKMELPASIVEIGEAAFMDSGSGEGDWESLTFAPGSKLERIGPHAFAYAVLKQLTIPASVRFIEDHAFHNSYDTIISFEPGSKLEHIGQEAFATTKMERFDIPQSLDKLGDRALHGVDLKSLHIPAHMRALGEYATPGYYLQEVTFAEGSQLEVIGGAAFKDSKITQVDLPASVKEIGDQAFAETEYLRHFHIPTEGGPLSIGREAFYSSALDQITLPKRVAEIGARAFRNTNMIIRVIHKERPEGWAENWHANRSHSEWAEEGDSWDGDWENEKDRHSRKVIWGWDLDKAKKPSNQGVRFSDDGTVLIQFPAKGKRKEYTLPTTVREIGPRAFYDAKRFTRLEIPPDSQLEVIGAQVFVGSGLREIILPPSLKRIEREAFWHPYDYDDIKGEHEESNKSWRQAELRREPVLDTVEFAPGCNPEYIDETAFAWHRLRTLRIPDSVQLLKKGQNMLVLDGSILLRYCQDRRVIGIPAYIRKIDRLAFQFRDFTELSFDLDSQLEEIGDEAFRESSVAIASLPPSLKRIGHRAFTEYEFQEMIFRRGCGLEYLPPDAVELRHLTRIRLGVGEFPKATNWRLIDDVLYNYDQNILLRYLPTRKESKFTVPAQVEEIAPYAFYDARELSQIAFEPGSRLKVIGERGFKYSGIQGITLPASLERIESEAFQSQSDWPCKLRALHFEPDSKLEYIGYCAFQNCPIANTIQLPDSVTYVSVYAFLPPPNKIVERYGNKQTVRKMGFVTGDVVIGPHSKLKEVEEDGFAGRKVIDQRQ